MKKSYLFALSLLLLCICTASATRAQQQTGEGIGPGRSSSAGQNAGPAGAHIGDVIADFTLSDTNGKRHSLASLKGKQGTVLIFISTQCPVSNAYNERMEKLSEDYKGRGINVVGINANATESVESVKSHATQNNLTFTILKDKGNKVADQLGATNTPEVFFLNADGKLVYRGRIDNSRSGQTISSNDLRDAIEATLSGKPVTNAFVRAFGCSIKRG